MGFLLFLISRLLSVLIYPVAFVTSIIISFRRTRFREGLIKLNQQFLEEVQKVETEVKAEEVKVKGYFARLWDAILGN